MVHENHCWQARDGVQKPPSDGSVMVYKNHREVGPQWCMRTTVGWVHDGVKKLLGDGWAMVRENHHGMGGRWCVKTIVGWVGDGVRKPPFGVCAMV